MIFKLIAEFARQEESSNKNKKKNRWNIQAEDKSMFKLAFSLNISYVPVCSVV